MTCLIRRFKLIMEWNWIMARKTRMTLTYFYYRRRPHDMSIATDAQEAGQHCNDMTLTVTLHTYLLIYKSPQTKTNQSVSFSHSTKHTKLLTLNKPTEVIEVVKLQLKSRKAAP